VGVRIFVFYDPTVDATLWARFETQPAMKKLLSSFPLLGLIFLSSFLSFLCILSSAAEIEVAVTADDVVDADQHQHQQGRRLTQEEEVGPTNKQPLKQQRRVIPNYTSPPLPEALAATPKAYRSDDYIQTARQLAKAGNCTAATCQIVFRPPSRKTSRPTTTVGIIFYGGALIDPRSYSPHFLVLSRDYGMTVVVPIFANDVAFVPCDSGRFHDAVAAFSSSAVDKWIMAGHSLGGTGAIIDLWALMMPNKENDVDDITSDNYNTTSKRRIVPNNIGGMVLSQELLWTWTTSSRELVQTCVWSRY
jgi:Alpha/beta hydrolase family